MKKTLRFAAFSAGAMLAGTGVASALPAPLAPSLPPPPAHPPHTVGTGESLSKISEAELGTSNRWVEIFALNRNTIANPNVVEVGQVLDIPSGPVAVPADLLAAFTPPSAPAPGPSNQSMTIASAGGSPPQAVSGGGAGGNLAAIRACESGGDYGSVDGPYRGAYQFDSQTWQSVGGSGDPAAASPAEQDARAIQLQAQRGSNPWPNCG